MQNIMVNWDFLDSRLIPGQPVCLASLRLSSRLNYHFVSVLRGHQ